jgi:hypothetical protein
MVRVDQGHGHVDADLYGQLMQRQGPGGQCLFFPRYGWKTDRLWFAIVDHGVTP